MVLLFEPEIRMHSIYIDFLFVLYMVCDIGFSQTLFKSTGIHPLDHIFYKQMSGLQSIKRINCRALTICLKLLCASVLLPDPQFEKM